GGDSHRPLGSGDEGRGAARAGAEVADAELIGVLVLGEPIGGMGQSASEQTDVEAQAGRLGVLGLLLGGEAIHQEGGDATVEQRLSNGAVTRAAPAAAAAVSEDDYAIGARRDDDVAVEHDAACWDAHGARSGEWWHAGHAGHGAASRWIG